VDDALGDSLVIEVGDLFPEDEVLEEGGPALAGPEGVQIVRDRESLVCRERRVRSVRGLVNLTSPTPRDLRCGTSCAEARGVLA
jgi:hypothetical protein